MLIPFNELRQRHNLDAKSALHLGANTGQEAEAYHQIGITRVVWVEALEELYLGLKRHIRSYQGHIALQACVSDMDDQVVSFHVASNGGQSSSFLEFGTHSKEHPEVRFVRDVTMKTARVDTLLEKHGITFNEKDSPFLNIDLQGAELFALRGMGQLLRVFKYAYIEVNQAELYIGCPLMGEVDEYLFQFGFRPVETKMTGAKWGDRFYLK